MSNEVNPNSVSHSEVGKIVIRKPISDWLIEIGKTSENDPEIRSQINQFAWAYLDENQNDASNWILSKPPDGIYAGAYEMMGAYFSKENGFSGISKLINGLSVKQKAVILEGAFHHLGAASTEKAIGFLFEEEENQSSKFPNRNLLISKVFSGATSNGRFDEAVAAAQEFLPKDVQTGAVDVVYRRWAKRELVPSLNSLVENYSNSNDFDYLLSGVFSIVDNSSRSEISTWTDTVPLGIRDRVKLILEEWNR